MTGAFALHFIISHTTTLNEILGRSIFRWTYFASQRPVSSSQKPSRSSNFLGGVLNRGEEGVPYAFRRLFPHPKLALVLTPVVGFVPLAYLQRACM